MNAYEWAQRLGFAGTDQQIVDQLKATGLTPNRIPLADLLFTLNNRGMLIRLIRPADTGEKWAGSVVNMVLALNASGTPEQAFAVNKWFSHITNDRNQFFDTTDPTLAAPFWQLYTLLAGVEGMPSAEDFKAVAALGGGWLFDGLTVERYTADKAIYDQAESDRLASIEADRIAQQIAARITNAAALASERISHADTAEQAAAKWAQAWAEAV